MMNLKAIFGSVAQYAASALGSVTQSQTQTTTPPTSSNAVANATQADEALHRVAARQARPSVFEEQVREISPDVRARRNIFDQRVSVELPKPAEQMTKADYNMAFSRAMLRQAGMTDATDGEVAKFTNDYQRVTGGKFELLWSEEQLHAFQKQHGQQIPAQTSRYGQAVADAGKRQIYADRTEYAARVEQLRRESQRFGEEAWGGFYKVQANGVINLANDATKIVGAPEIPKFEVGGEYWQDKQGVAETATTITAGVLTGGASVAGDALVIASSAGNLAEAATGEEFRTGEQLSTTERVIKGGTGLLGAYSVRGRVDEMTEAVSSQVRNVKPPSAAAEAVTAEGVRVPVSSADDVLSATNVEARAAKDVSVSGRRTIHTHEAAGGHTIEEHVGKSDVELRSRLAREPKLDYASSFYNEAIANRAQMEFVTQHKKEIAEWLKSGNFRFVGDVEMNQSVGKVVGRGKSSTVVEANKVRVILLRNDSPQGWYIRTSFPIR